MPFTPNPRMVTEYASRFPKRPTVGSQVDLAKGPAYPDKTGVTDQVTINKPPPGAGMGGGPMIHPPPNIGGIGGPSMGGGLANSSPSYSGGFGMRNPMPGGVGQFTTQPAPMPTRVGMAKGGSVSGASRGDGCVRKGHTKGKVV